jgi:hypothetical protein
VGNICGFNHEIHEIYQLKYDKQQEFSASLHDTFEVMDVLVENYLI